MKIAYRASDIIEAHIVAGMLEAHGIAAHVGGHYLQGAVGDLSPTGFANVFVLDDDLEQASALIRKYEQRDEVPADDAEAARQATTPRPAT